jgi:hypothetical protein
MDLRDFWCRKEAEIGETVEAKFFCTYLKGDWPVDGPLTGVLYFSKTRLFFQSFHSAKSLASLVQPRRREGLSESHTLQLPLQDLRCSFEKSPKNLWSRLFAAPEQSFVIQLGDGLRDSGSYRFSIDRKQLKEVVDLINRNRSGVQR